VFLAPLYMNIALIMEKFEKKMHFFKNIFVGYTGAVFFAIIQLNILYWANSSLANKTNPTTLEKNRNRL